MLKKRLLATSLKQDFQLKHLSATSVSGEWKYLAKPWSQQSIFTRTTVTAPSANSHKRAHKICGGSVHRGWLAAGWPSHAESCKLKVFAKKKPDKPSAVFPSAVPSRVSFQEVKELRHQTSSALLALPPFSSWLPCQPSLAAGRRLDTCLRLIDGPVPIRVCEESALANDC